MKRLIIFLFSITLHAATFYVSSAGNDSNAGTSAGSAWLTLSHALDPANGIHCGDTVVVVANWSYVSGDANLPYFPGCSLVTTIQSSAISQFAPAGYRTNPANDAPLYGKLQFRAQGIIAQPEPHGSNFTGGNYGACWVSGIASSVFTLGYCGSGMPNLANGSQIEFEINSAGNLSATAVPAPLTFMQHYYVVNCSVACGRAGSTLQVAATVGGPPITITSCDAVCIAGILITEPLQFTPSSSTITSPDAFTAIGNGTPVTLGAVGLQSFGVLPAPLMADTIYYIVGLSGRTFQLSATPGGPPIIMTSVGLGPSNLANTTVPHHWAFRGLEFVEKPGQVIFNLLQLGSGGETSIYGMVSHIEVDHCWLHDNPGDASGPLRGIADNGTFMYFHDNYIAGMRYSESQAIAGWGSPGPTAIVNNFLEAATENTLYGGNNNLAGVPNANKIFSGNYYYKPPLWKIASSTGAASGPCLYDATDPNHAGGEWYTDTATGLNYQCTSNGTWAPTGLPVPAGFAIKNMAEHKSGRNFTYSGNLFNYSWLGSQKGQAISFHQSEDSGPAHANDHNAVINNKVMNVVRFFTGQSHCRGSVAIPCIYLPAQNTFVNNLAVMNVLNCGVGFTTVSKTCGTQMIADTWDGYPAYAAYSSHNTIVMPDGADVNYSAQAFFASTDDGSPGCPLALGFLDLWNYKNNIVGFDFQGDCFNGGGMFAHYFTNSNFHHIAMTGSNPGISYVNPGPSNTFTNFFRPANNAAMQYVNAGAGDYHLSATSPFSAQNPSPTLLSDDGTDLGADIDLVNMATSGAAAGTPPWDRLAGLRVNPGSSQMVFRYTAPTAAACTATIYNAPARIAANQVASAADNSASSVSDALTREIYISGLQASTHYWYKLACGGGVVLVGNLVTRPLGAGSLPFSFDWSTPTAMQYSSSRNMSNPVLLPAATRQFVPVAANSVVYAQVGQGGPVTILIAP